MTSWLLRHGPAVMIFVGGLFAAVCSFIAERKASGEREKRRVGRWPRLIMLGAIVSGVGSLWAGHGQDQILDYLSGGDSYGFFVPGPPIGNSIQFYFVARGDAPLYDVFVDASDMSKWEKSWLEKGWPPEALDPNSGWGDSRGKVPTDQLMALMRLTKTTILLGNVAPGSIRPAWEIAVPQGDDQRYGFSIWARNGLVTEQLLMHRTSSGWASAWRVQRTSPQVTNGKHWEERLEESTDGFPSDRLTWK